MQATCHICTSIQLFEFESSHKLTWIWLDSFKLKKIYNIFLKKRMKFHKWFKFLPLFILESLNLWNLNRKLSLRGLARTKRTTGQTWGNKTSTPCTPVSSAPTMLTGWTKFTPIRGSTKTSLVREIRICKGTSLQENFKPENKLNLFLVSAKSWMPIHDKLDLRANSLNSSRSDS